MIPFATTADDDKKCATTYTYVCRLLLPWSERRTDRDKAMFGMIRQCSGMIRLSAYRVYYFFSLFVPAKFKLTKTYDPF